jgi:putative ATP-dependent endonuclease of OLD family
MSLWNEVKAEYPDGHEPTKTEAYKIFEPLNENTVSKAVTAQYLAGMILGELPPISNGVMTKEELKQIVMTDQKFEYLVKAIEHVTQ